MLRSTIREDDKLTEPMSLDQFGRKLRGVFVSVDIHAQIFFILDGLNSDEGIKNVIMHEILRVNRSRANSDIFRCVISSRFACEARISTEDLVEIDLTSEPGVQHDLSKFAISRLGDISRTSLKTGELSFAVAKQLCSRANGVFLWLALALEDIQRMKYCEDLIQTINLLPDSIDGFYSRALQQIPYQDVETVQKLFSWLTVASRLLYLPELLEALAVTADHPQLRVQSSSTAKKLSPPKTPAEIRRICGWLVTVTKEGIVSLRHPTLREYLLRAVEPSNLSRQPVLAAHELLARSCLVLLSSVIWLDQSAALTETKPAQKLSRGTTSTLTTYAAENWSIHYRLSETHSKILAGTLQRCLTITLDYDCQSFSIPNNGRSIQIANTTLRISASYGLVSLTQLCLQMGTDPKGGSCVLCKSPLAIAFGSGHLEAAKILSQGTADPASRISSYADGMIHFAVVQGSTDFIKTFLECGAKVDAVENNSGKTLLHVAAESGRLDIVRLLIAYDANINAIIPTTRETPLHLAAARGYIHIVKYIVDGQDPSMMELELYDSIVRQPYYQTLTEDLITNEGRKQQFVWGVEARDTAEQHMRILRSCSTRYSDINLRTSTGHTALELAAANGYDNIVRFLLERGADYRGEKVGRCTALQAAVEDGHLEIVKLLLSAGASMHQQTDGLAPILQQACNKGHDAVADFVVWQCFIAELTGKRIQWPVLCLPTKTTNTVVRDALLKRKPYANFSRKHNRLVQRLNKLGERPKD